MQARIGPKANFLCALRLGGLERGLKFKKQDEFSQLNKHALAHGNGTLAEMKP
jgi:hypothetical protein